MCLHNNYHLRLHRIEADGANTPENPPEPTRDQQQQQTNRETERENTPPHNYDVTLMKIYNLDQIIPPSELSFRIFLLPHFKFNKKNISIIIPLLPGNDDAEADYNRRRFLELPPSENVYGLDWVSKFPNLAILPHPVIYRGERLPLKKWHAFSRVLAAFHALQHGWSINLRGRFNYASLLNDDGFCLFTDIILIMNVLSRLLQDCSIQYMIIDLHPHKGEEFDNDYEIDEVLKAPVYIFEMYYSGTFSTVKITDRLVYKKRIDIGPNMVQEDYLAKLEEELDESVCEFRPDLIIYNAGTDCLNSRPFAKLNLTTENIARRDEIVFRKARLEKIPITMLTGDGYRRNTATISTRSISNLYTKRLLHVEGVLLPFTRLLPRHYC